MCGTFGSTSDGTPRAFAALDRRLRGGLRDRALLVVGDQDHVGAGGRLADLLRQRGLEIPVRRAIALVVDPRHLLVARRHDAELPRRAAVAVGDAPPPVPMPASRRSASSRVPSASLPTRPAISTRAAERRDVVRHVRGAAEAIALVIELDDRHRRFRRNAVDPPDHEVIEHQVADDQHRCGRAPDRAAPGDQSARRAWRRARRRDRRAFRRVGQRDEDEEQHQELGVAEIVFEQPRRQHRADHREPGVRQRRVVRPAPLQEIAHQRDDEPQPDRAAPAGRARRRSAAARCAGAGSAG